MLQKLLVQFIIHIYHLAWLDNENEMHVAWYWISDIVIIVFMSNNVMMRRFNIPAP